MNGFVLFSLDTLVSVPRMYAFALKKVFPKMSQKDIMEMIADVGADSFLLVQDICQSKHSPDYGRMRDGPTSEFVSESIILTKESVPYRKKLEKVLYEDAGKCVKKYSSDLVHRVAGAYKTGLFGIQKQAVMKQIARKLGLPFDVVVGYEDEKRLAYVVDKAKRLSECDEMWLMVRKGNDFEKIAEATSSHYIEVENSVNAPLCRVASVLRLNV